MDRSGILEIKKKFKIGNISITSLGSALISSEEEHPVFVTEERFLSMDDDMQKKYLSLLSKSFSAAGGAFAEDVDVDGDIKRILLALSKGDKIDKGIFENLTMQFAENYAAPGQYVLLAFTDNYDVMDKDTSKTKTGESEIVFPYVTLLLCPVKPTKAGLTPSKANMKVVESDIVQIIQPPVASFLYPAFIDRSADEDKIFCCVKGDYERNLVSAVFNTEVPEKPVISAAAKIKTKADALAKDYAKALKNGEELPLFNEVSADMTTSLINIVSESTNESPDEDTGSSTSAYVDELKDLLTVVKKPKEYLSSKNQERYSLEQQKNLGEEVSYTEQTASFNSLIPSKEIMTTTENGRKYYVIPADRISLDDLEDIME